MERTTSKRGFSKDEDPELESAMTREYNRAKERQRVLAMERAARYARRSAVVQPPPQLYEEIEEVKMVEPDPEPPRAIVQNIQSITMVDKQGIMKFEDLQERDVQALESAGFGPEGPIKYGDVNLKRVRLGRLEGFENMSMLKSRVGEESKEFIKEVREIVASNIRKNDTPGWGIIPYVPTSTEYRARLGIMHSMTPEFFFETFDGGFRVEGFRLKVENVVNMQSVRNTLKGLFNIEIYNDHMRTETEFVESTVELDTNRYEIEGWDEDVMVEFMYQSPINTITREIMELAGDVRRGYIEAEESIHESIDSFLETAIGYAVVRKCEQDIDKVSEIFTTSYNALNSFKRASSIFKLWRDIGTNSDFSRAHSDFSRIPASLIKVEEEKMIEVEGPEMEKWQKEMSYLFIELIMFYGESGEYDAQLLMLMDRYSITPMVLCWLYASMAMYAGVLFELLKAIPMENTHSTIIIAARRLLTKYMIPQRLGVARPTEEDGLLFLTVPDARDSIRGSVTLLTRIIDRVGSGIKRVLTDSAVKSMLEYDYEGLNGLYFNKAVETPAIRTSNTFTRFNWMSMFKDNLTVADKPRSILLPYSQKLYTNAGINLPVYGTTVNRRILMETIAFDDTVSTVETVNVALSFNLAEHIRRIMMEIVNDEQAMTEEEWENVEGWNIHLSMEVQLFVQPPEEFGEIPRDSEQEMYRYITADIWILLSSPYIGFNNIRQFRSISAWNEKKNINMGEEEHEVLFNDLVKSLSESLLSSENLASLFAQIGSGAEDAQNYSDMRVTRATLISFPESSNSIQTFAARIGAFVVVKVGEEMTKAKKNLAIPGIEKSLEQYRQMFKIPEWGENECLEQCLTYACRMYMGPNPSPQRVQLANKMLSDFKGRKRLSDLVDCVDMLSGVVRPLANAVTVVFIIESCQILLLGSKADSYSIRDVLTNERFDGNGAPFFAVEICVQGMPNMSHIFPTTQKRLVEYIRNASVHRLREREKYHGQFTLAPYPVNIKSKSTHNTATKETLMDNVLTLDLETFAGVGVEMKPYMCAIYGNIMGRKVSEVIEGRPEAVFERMEIFFRDLETERSMQDQRELPELYIYAHNGSEFDWVILLPMFLRMFPDCIVYGRSTDIKKLVIPNIKVTMHDFCLTVTRSLKEIAKEFGCTNEMECDEIRFVESFEDIPQDVLAKIEKYCLQDCVSLFEAITKFSQEVLDMMSDDSIGVNKIKNPHRAYIFCTTSSALALEFFTQKFIEHDNPIRGNVSQLVDDIERDAYFGGVTQVFNHSMQVDVKYIDVNSLYPAAMNMIKVSRVPANTTYIFKYVLSVDIKNKQLDPWSVYRVHYFKMCKQTLGMLPVRLESGGLCYPESSAKVCWRAGVELVALIENGMLEELIITSVMEYTELEQGIFSNYVKYFYDKESEPGVSKVRRTLAKSLLNQLYGKTAQRQFESRFIVSSETWANDPHLLERKAMAGLNINILDSLIDHNNNDESQKEVFEALMEPESVNEWMTKRLKDKYVPQIKSLRTLDQNRFVECTYSALEQDLDFVGSVKRIAMFTTAQARAIMINALGVLRKHNPKLLDEVYYMDTDSFFLSTECFMILQSKGLIDNARLGAFKDEYPNKLIREAMFVAPKVYYLVTEDQEGRKEFEGKYKGIVERKVDKEGEELKVIDNREIFMKALDPDENQGRGFRISQEIWRKQFSSVVVTEMTEKLITQTRRYVNKDGSTEYYKDQDACEKHHKDERLVFKNNEFYYVDIMK